MDVVLFESEPREHAAFGRLDATCKVTFVDPPLCLENVATFAGAKILSTFIYSDLSREVLALLPNLKLIATRSTGVDHIDLSYCRERGIEVCNVPIYGENTVAEHVFALLLAISHRLPEAIARARSGRFSPEGLEGFDLQGRTLGVVGVGSIGRCVIRIAKGFGMRVLGCDVNPNPACAAELGFSYVDFDHLLGAADVITLHAPALPDGQRLIDEAAFARMKDGVTLINTARGSLVDSRALIGALRSGKVANAGLDVLAEESLIREEAELVVSARFDQRDLRGLVADHVLLDSPRVIVTPHSAFNTTEAVGRIAVTTMANIEGFLAGALLNQVTEPQESSLTR